jgi:hypothetical protein
MSSIGPNWDTSWTTTSINGSTVTNGSTATTSSAISHTGTPGKAGTAIGVTVAYGGTATAGLVVYIAKEVDGTPTYEAIADEPQGVVLPFAVSTTVRREFTVLGTDCPSFKVIVKNPSGASVTVTVGYRQYSIDCA